LLIVFSWYAPGRFGLFYTGVTGSVATTGNNKH
jgi:hypothetical protein